MIDKKKTGPLPTFVHDPPKKQAKCLSWGFTRFSTPNWLFRKPTSLPVLTTTLYSDSELTLLSLIGTDTLDNI